MSIRVLKRVPNLGERQDSPWYPTMRLFRQEKLLDWPPVFERMAAALRARVPATAQARAVAIEVAPGELIDKLTILEIKSARFRDAAKLAHVHHERALLAAALDRAGAVGGGVIALGGAPHGERGALAGGGRDPRLRPPR